MSSPQSQRFQTGRVLTIGGAHAVHDTYTAFLPPLLPAFISRLLLSKTEAGLLTVFLTAPSLLQPLIGHLADRVSLRYFVILAPCVSATMMSLLGVAPGYGILMLLLLVSGLSSASIHAVGPVMVGRLSGQRLGRGMGIWMVGGELGRALGPIVIVTAVRFLDLRGTPWLMIGGLAASALLYLRLRDVPGRPVAAPVGLPWRAALRAMGTILAPLIGVIAARAFMVSALTTYLPIFLSEEGAGLWFAGAALSIIEAAGVAGALAGGSLSDWFGRRQIVAISILVTPVLMGLFFIAEGWVRFPLLVLMGLTVLSVTPVVMAIVQETFPENRALANGVYMAVSFSLRSVVIVIMGGMGDLLGMNATFLISAAAGLAGLPFVFFLPGDNQSR